jgi:hypothetical protein
MPDGLVSRLRRIYASIHAIREFDMMQLPAKVFQSKEIVSVFQDFAGNLTEHDMANAAHTVIHNIANLQNHLKRWIAT